MGTWVDPGDLAEDAPSLSSGRAQALIDGAEARAKVAAPCLAGNLTPDQIEAVKSVLVGVVLRWAESGSGALQSQTMGPFAATFDTRPAGGSGRRLWPSDIKELRAICRAGNEARAFTFTPAPATTNHLPWCASVFGADYCSCGADIAGRPIYELADDE